MNMTSREVEPVDRSELNLWFCVGCGVVHLTAGGMRLSFNRAEYASFTEMVVDTYYSGWPQNGVNMPLHNLGEIDADNALKSSEVLN